MCLAEALLRIPDDATADLLIAEKLAGGDWSAHAGRSDSLFVNASTWALMLTGAWLIFPRSCAGMRRWFRGLARRVGDPIVRQALRRGMRIIGGEFVVVALSARRWHAAAGARTVPVLLRHAGEGARTDEDAKRYLDSYRRAILAIGSAVG